MTSVVSDGSESRWIERELRPLVGLTSSNGKSGDGGSSAPAAWRRFFEGVAEDRATVLVFEDLHWADAGLLDFVDDLVNWVRGVPLLVVATARPELLHRRVSWGGGKANATTISLPPLGDDETARLVSTLIAQPFELAEDQRALLDRAGERMPLFAEQYVRMLSERGTTAEVPESVQAIIAARLYALPIAEKELLQDAAVHGRVFWLEAVGKATGVESTEVGLLLDSLERKEFVGRERRYLVAGNSQYAFQHVLLRDVAYGQIPRRSRAGKHRRAAEWIEGLGRSSDHAELLAHHYLQALELGRAAGVEDDPSLLNHARESCGTQENERCPSSTPASAARILRRGA